MGSERCPVALCGVRGSAAGVLKTLPQQPTPSPNLPTPPKKTIATKRFWSFSASRRWSAQHHARPAADGDAPPQRAPQERAVLNTQLAGLRQRAAIRHTKKGRDGSPPGSPASGPAAANAQQDQQHHHHAQQQPAGGQEQPQHHYQQPAAEQAHSGTHEQPQPPQQHHHQQQQHWRPPRPPSVEYDCAAMSDGVNMANAGGLMGDDDLGSSLQPPAVLSNAAAALNLAPRHPPHTHSSTPQPSPHSAVGYDPWSAEAAAAARRPQFSATESVKSQVVDQLGGLKRRAAAKRRADGAEEQRRAAGRGAAGAAARQGPPQQGYACVDDDPWNL
jgi:hypothetical protein